MARRQDHEPAREDAARERGRSDQEEPFPLEDEVEDESLDEGEDMELPG